MSRYERWNDLLSLLASSGRLSVEEAAAELNVSAATIRRDFDQLAQQQMLTRTRGGAVAHTVTYDLPLRYKSARRVSQKQRIATAAADLVRAGAVVGINGGTTTTELARALATRADLRGGGSSAITIVTNALNIANELVVRPHVKIVLTGGVALPQSYELVGPLSNGVFDQVTLDVAFLGVSGLDVERGATCLNEDEANINRQMAVRAEHVVVAADGSKLGARSFARICGIGEIDTLVTDTDADVRPFEEAGVKVIQA